ncbi:MAG TPA: GPW/gp25 family protein [Thermomicrobiales bacterium]|jgi:phage baseplate assembly protein W|nr:GPW/gp25 family protein [Thermomicrobiales bacterium]
MSQVVTSIRYPFAIDAGLGRLAIEAAYAAHVEQLIRQVLMTNPGERINRPDFGCGLRRMVFAPNSEVTASLLQVTVFQALTTWLGSVIEVNRVEVEAHQEVLQVRITYLVRANQERRYLNLEVSQ